MKDAAGGPGYEEAALNYQAKLVKYQAELADYHRRLDHWWSLSDAQREKLDRAKEMENRALWSVLLAISTAIALLLWLASWLKGGELWWAWGGGAVVSWVIILPLSRFLGPVVRGVVIGFVGVAIAVVILYFVRANLAIRPAFDTELVLGGALGVVGFVSGLCYRASAAPKQPARPVAPRAGMYK